MSQELEDRYLAFLEQAAEERGAVLSRNTKKLLAAHLDKFSTEEEKDRELNRLLKQQFCPDAICINSQPFITAIARGDHQTFDAMFKAYPELLNPQTKAGQTALYTAAGKGLQHGDMHFLRAIDMYDHNLVNARIVTPMGHVTNIQRIVAEQMHFSSPDSVDFDRAESAKVVIGALGREHGQESQIAGNFHANQHTVAQANARAREHLDVANSDAGRAAVMQESNIELPNKVHRIPSEEEYRNAQAFLKRAGAYEQQKERAKERGEVYTEFPLGLNGSQLSSSADYERDNSNASKTALAYIHAKHAAENAHAPKEDATRKYAVSPGEHTYKPPVKELPRNLLGAVRTVNINNLWSQVEQAAKIYESMKTNGKMSREARAAWASMNFDVGVNGGNGAVKALASHYQEVVNFTKEHPYMAITQYNNANRSTGPNDFVSPKEVIRESMARAQQMQEAINETQQSLVGAANAAAQQLTQDSVSGISTTPPSASTTPPTRAKPRGVHADMENKATEAARGFHSAAERYGITPEHRDAHHRHPLHHKPIGSAPPPNSGPDSPVR